MESYIFNFFISEHNFELKKSNFSFFFKVKGVQAIIRQCASELYGKCDCYTTDGSSFQNICTCKGESDRACNRSTRNIKSIFLISVVCLFSI